MIEGQVRLTDGHPLRWVSEEELTDKVDGCKRVTKISLVLLLTPKSQDSPVGLTFASSNGEKSTRRANILSGKGVDSLSSKGVWLVMHE